MTSLVLPEPPSANQYWIGRVYKSPLARDYRAEVAEIIHERGVRPLDGPVEVQIRWYRRARRGDLDNRIKVALDALQGGLYHDDKQVVRIVAERYEDRDDPRIELEVRRA